MNMILMETATASDEQLWRLACEGDREAFTRIVERYQSLVCSLAYSACGTLGTSEDMAQETFITAWHRLKDLREPGKLRQWLCGIVRNIAANAVRRDLRRGGEPESLDAAADQHSGESDPAAQAITREEETLLWRTLAEMPAGYREPLVLFYREEKSVAEVALKLEGGLIVLSVQDHLLVKELHVGVAERVLREFFIEIGVGVEYRKIRDFGAICGRDRHTTS